MPDFASLSLPVNLAAFVGGAAIVWLAGTRLTHYADAIAKQYGLGQAPAGIMILAAVTSLPEIATSFSAAIAGDAPLAVNNLLGSIALQVVALALADLVFDRRALTSIVPDPNVLLQGAMNVVLLAVVATAVIYGDRLVLGAGLWTWGLAVAAAYCIATLARGEGRQPWVAEGLGEGARQSPRPAENGRNRESSTRAWNETSGSGSEASSGPSLPVKTAAAGAAILVAGYVVATSGAALAMQTGLGSSFMGVALLAFATSLPEFSTVFAAMRRGLYTMAISDILGTNIFNIALLFGIDAVAGGEPVLTRVGPFAAVGALLGVVVTGLFVMGVAERRDRTILRMGLDSAAVLIVYAGGLVMLFTLRSAT